MAPPQACVVGVDGLPLGTSAVVVVDGAIVSEMALISDGGRPLDLEQRVEQAVRVGGELARRPVDEVRLALLDDGAAGTGLHALTARLVAVDVTVRVVDLTEAGSGPIEPQSGDPSDRRARIAALGAAGAAGS